MSHAPGFALPTITDVEAAAVRIAPVVVRTPLLRCDLLDAATGARAFVKAECLQRFGAFKLRGAYNRIAAFSEEERSHGVLAYSSGNHAIAVAASARMFGVPAVIVMPADAPEAKLRRTQALGAEVVTYDRVRESREDIGRAIASERGLALVKPFDDPFVIAGQGTAGLEIAQDLTAMGLRADLALVCASGGGLVSGVALALKAANPDCAVYAVEPEGHDDIARSLASGRIMANPAGVRSICDALLVERMGEIPFALAPRLLAGAVSVSDDQALAAMAFAFDELKLVIEPGGAVALAALLAGAVPAAGKTVAIVASGGNVDPATFRRALDLA